MFSLIYYLKSQHKTFFCIKHWPSNYRTYSKKGHQIPVDPLSIFSVHSSFAPQARSVPRKVKDTKNDSESRSSVTQKRLEQVDTISSWESLIEFSYKLIRGGFKGGVGGASPPYFFQSLVFCNHFEELQTKLLEVELIINNAPLIYVYQIL